MRQRDIKQLLPGTEKTAKCFKRDTRGRTRGSSRCCDNEADAQTDCLRLMGAQLPIQVGQIICIWDERVTPYRSEKLLSCFPIGRCFAEQAGQTADFKPVFLFFPLKDSSKLTSPWKINLEFSTLPATADSEWIWQKSVILHYLVDSSGNQKFLSVLLTKLCSLLIKSCPVSLHTLSHKYQNAQYANRKQLKFHFHFFFFKFN